ncbi:hypothetical protein FRC02_010285 [Tulasnella sp. 418]|nr:hypothetical protein FRC02_010285 [Tulasnella sp. 418]
MYVNIIETLLIVVYRTTSTGIGMVSVWLTKTPFIFLILSVLLFSAGLVVWTYSSQQKPVVSVCTTIIAVVALFALPVAFLFWVAFEYWTFSHIKEGTKWLTDMAQDMTDEMRKKKEQGVSRWIRTRLSSARQSTGSNVDIERHEISQDENIEQPTEVSNSRLQATPSAESGRSHPDHVLPTYLSQLCTDPIEIGDIGTLNDETKGHNEQSMPMVRFKKTIEGVLYPPPQDPDSGVVSEHPLPPERNISNRQSTFMSTTSGSGSQSFWSRHDTYDDPPKFPSELISTLRGFETSQLLYQHQTSIRCLQFSPDGNYLASGSKDRTAIWKQNGDVYELDRKFEQRDHGDSIQEVVWSPTGEHLLFRSSKRVKIWTVETNNLNIIKRKKAIQSTIWLPDGHLFAIIESDSVYIMDLDGTEKGHHPFKGKQIHAATFAPDGERIIFVATLEKSGRDLQISKCQAERRIIAYNMETTEIEDQMPVPFNVRSVSVSSDGKRSLVSYEDAHPPELWRIQNVRENKAAIKLHLHYACHITELVKFTGPSCFGGAEDQFILCASTSGRIHIWDRESGRLLHSHQASQTGESGVLTGMAWSPADPNYVALASGHRDGNIRVWSAPPPRSA